jgi:hypothetical protein
LGGHDGFNRVGNDLTGLQREAHPLGAHRHTIADADGVKPHPHKTGGLDTFLDLFGQRIQVHIAGIALVPAGSDADLRLVHIVFGQTRRIEHRLRGALGFGLGNTTAVCVERIFHKLFIHFELCFQHNGISHIYE